MRTVRALSLFVALATTWPAQAEQTSLQAGMEAVGRRDFAAAQAIFKPLAEAGNVVAQVNLGNLYMKGWGVEQDYALALRWYRSAADQGERMAQTKLGILYYFGLGTDKNPAEAARWFQKAAGQGEIRAQSILGTLYANGEGVPKDLAQAFYWYTMAEEQGDQEAAKGRHSLEEELTPGQRDEALRLMRETRKQRTAQEEKAFAAATAGIKPQPAPSAGEAAKPSDTEKQGAGKAKKKPHVPSAEQPGSPVPPK